VPANGDALTLDDLIGMQLNADIVVMSACRTGQGKANGGDDMLGLTRGLLAAGAQSAVVSLRQVDAIATSLMMANVDRGLRAGKSAAIALQDAQNALRMMHIDDVRQAQSVLLKGALASRPATNPQQRGQTETVDNSAPPDPGADPDLPYAHPYFWAPFLLVGNWF